jgi:segregation and condensation protein B
MDNLKISFLHLNKEDKKSFLEALIFSADEALSLSVIYNMLFPAVNNRIDAKLIDEQEVEIHSEIQEDVQIFSEKNILELIDEINHDLEQTGRPYSIINVGGGYLYAIRSEYGMLLNQLIKNKSKKRLSHASLETLAIIGYRQPVTKPEIESIRGVNSGEIISSLIDKNLVEILGRKDALGKPMLYGTTLEFLRVFGLKSLQDLPKLRELTELENFEDEEKSEIELVVNSSLSDSVDDIQTIPIYMEEGDNELEGTKD